MNGDAGVEHWCRTCQRGKPLIITERTTYRKMDEWTCRGWTLVSHFSTSQTTYNNWANHIQKDRWMDMQGLNIGVALVNVANHL